MKNSVYNEKIEKTIRLTIQDMYPILDEKSIAMDESLVNKLELDSMSFLRLVVSLEEAFSITVDDELLLIEKFNTLRKIVSIISVALKKEEQ